MYYASGRVINSSLGVKTLEAYKSSRVRVHGSEGLDPMYMMSARRKVDIIASEQSP